MKIPTMLAMVAPALAPAHVLPPPPPPAITVADLRAGEKPIAVEQTEETLAENAFFRRNRISFSFTNPNARAMAGELEFPLPDGAFVCGYALEINGEMYPGVVCEKEKARVAFENEVRKGVDPGLVERVKGNVWKTRIFPLSPAVARKARVEYIAPKPVDCECAPGYERDGDDVFEVKAAGGCDSGETASGKIAAFSSGAILWDASLSAAEKSAFFLSRLALLPEKGEWTLVAFADRPRVEGRFDSRDALCAAAAKVVYDGGTRIDVEGALAAAGMPADAKTLLFTDEIDTLSLAPADFESRSNVVVATRPDAKKRRCEVRKLASGEKPPEGAKVAESTLLATVWAARRMEDLASQAETRKDEFLALGRKYGVAGEGLSLIVLETLDQWLANKIEPPAELSIHAEWARRRAAEDDPIAAKKAKAEHEQNLLKYWEERVKWWNDPIPPKATPTSGLFEGVRNMAPAARGRAAAPAPDEGAESDGALAMEESVTMMESAVAAEPAPAASASAALRAAGSPGAVAARARGDAGSGAKPSVALQAWNPKTPYIDALDAAEKGKAYETYLAERGKNKSAPAFYLDCAHWFFKAGENALAERIISNLAEFKLEDAALWRTMGWRLREAGAMDFAVLAFRKALALRGEEGQSRRDLALVLADRGKARSSAADVEEAMKLFADAAFTPRARRSARRGNDFQVSVIALEELNGLVAWSAAHDWNGAAPDVPEFDAAFRRDLPVKLRIVMSWDADETDIDLHVLEPDGVEAYYAHRRTSSGGFVSEDVTTGYGPEEYLRKTLQSGEYKILSNYFASHQTSLTGATVVQATVYTDWGTADESMRIITLRLDKPKSKHLVGSVSL